MGLLEKLGIRDRVVDVDIAELETESGSRLDQLSPPIRKFVAALAIIWTLFQLYTGSSV